MDKRVCLATGDKVKIIDRDSSYYDKEGIIIDIRSVIDSTQDVAFDNEVIIFIVELDNINQGFRENQIKKVKSTV